jgi:hypothetical protein
MKALGIEKLTIALTFAALISTPTFAQNASSKATAAINTGVGCTSTGVSTIGDTLPVTCHDIFSGASVAVNPDNFVPVMTSTMKVSNSQSIFVSPSLVTGLYTNTTAKTHTGSTSTAMAAGGVYLRAVLRDPNTGAVVQIADPIAACSDAILGCVQDSSNHYGVVLDSRVQTLTQTLSSCVVTVGTTAGTCNFDSTLQLVLDTTSAHTFNFIFPNVGVGTYTISVEAAVNTSASVSGSGTAIAGAAYGLGSMTAESVRLVHDFSF